MVFRYRSSRSLFCFITHTNNPTKRIGKPMLSGFSSNEERSASMLLHPLSEQKPRASAAPRSPLLTTLTCSLSHKNPSFLLNLSLVYANLCSFCCQKKDIRFLNARLTLQKIGLANESPAAYLEKRPLPYDPNFFLAVLTCTDPQ